MQPSKPAAFYARASTAKQEHSLETQLDPPPAYAKSNNLNSPEPLTSSEPDTSGSIPLAKRPNGKLFLNTIEYHKNVGEPIKHLIITKIDRLFRSTLDFCETAETLSKLGIALHIIDCGGSSLSTAGPFGE